MSKDKKKRRRADALKAAVVASLTECAYRLDFCIETISNGSNLADSSCTREGLAITLRDLQERLGGIRNTLRAGVLHDRGSTVVRQAGC